MVAISRLSSSGENPCHPVVGSRCGYDSNGNRTNGNNSTPGSRDNRQSTDGTYNYSYDGEGNLTGRTAIATGDVRLFSYDYRNRLTELIDHQGSTSGMLLRDVTFTYDVNNLRIAKSVNGVATRYVYDGQNLVQEFNPGRSTPQEFLYGPAVDQILADNLENGAVLWALTDNLGSVRDLLSTVGQSPGQLVDHITYTSFGVQTDSMPMTNFLFGFTGAVFDAETGLQYHRARYYDPVIGRWISQDPIEADAQNEYRNVYNSPTNATDPSGEDFIALGNRAVDNTAGIAYHYSLEYWKSNCPAPSATNAGISPASVQNASKGRLKNNFGILISLTRPSPRGRGVCGRSYF